jgi:hypothetical protein
MKRAKRTQYGIKRNVCNLIIMLKGLGSTQEEDQSTRRKKDHPTKMLVWIKEERTERSQI